MAKLNTNEPTQNDRPNNGHQPAAAPPTSESIGLRSRSTWSKHCRPPSHTHVHTHTHTHSPDLSVRESFAAEETDNVSSKLEKKKNKKKKEEKKEKKNRQNVRTGIERLSVQSSASDGYNGIE